MSRVAVVSRGDPLTSYLHAAIGRRFPIAADIDVELGGLRRAAAAVATFRPDRDSWGNAYSKSMVGFRLRSGLAATGLSTIDGGFDVAVQTHALFSTRARRTIVYIDCTYREAMLGWPAWTPQRRRAAGRWMANESRVYREAAHLFTFTEQGRDSLTGHYGIDASKITVVGAGVNFDDLPHVPKQRARVGRPTVLFVGKDFERKGGDVLLRAFELVRRIVPGARLQVVGTTLPGPVPDNVDVLGLVTDRARLAELYASATVFCLPSRFEPGGIAVLEAMSHGLPCVVSRDASHLVPEMAVGLGTGCVVDRDDAAGLSRGILAYLQDPQLAARAGRSARRAVADRHLWTHVVDRMAPAIDAVARS